MDRRQKCMDELALHLSIYSRDHCTELRSLSINGQYEKLRQWVEGYIQIDDSMKFLSISDQDVQECINNNVYSKTSTQEPKVIFNRPTWKPWLDSRKRMIQWAFSNQYLVYLLNDKHWSKEAVNSVESTSMEILSHCGDPLSDKPVFVKGLVVGDIQSGKTANYTALINEAIDAGFKVIIVFTGTTNELRAQTQRRLDYEVVGKSRDENGVGIRDVGVGLRRRGESLKVACLTDANIKGDIKRPSGVYAISRSSPCYLAVIKKTPGSLRNVIGVIQSSAEYGDTFSCPVLVIDDEADLASINTKDSSSLSGASGTNRLIRELLFRTCKNVTYVGYTATPFANVFVKPYEEIAADDADDIFPDDFIVTLPTPPDYSGVRAYFGVTPDMENDDSHVNTQLLEEISEEDREGFKIYQTPGVAPREQTNLFFPDSLEDAMMCFLIGVGIKISRGIRQNCTMLVNVDVRTIYNKTLRDNVRDKFDSLCDQFLVLSNIRQKFQRYWEEKMKPVSLARRANEDRWDAIEQGIREAIAWKTADSVKLVTGSRDSDVLDYSKTEHGLYVVVGGMKLSRGLTLEGLSVSYYGRKTNTFDTLLQMGRWFGYRNGWLDVCRVFTTKQIANDFIEACISLESFKQQIAQMEKEESTPREFGLQVLTYATSMLPTSMVKMREAVRQKITFSGLLSQVLDYRFDQKDGNLDLVEKFVHDQGPAHLSLLGPTNSNYVIRKIGVEPILQFLEKYRCPSSIVTLWRDYIQRMNAYGELSNWTVVLSNISSHGKEADLYLDGNRYPITKAERSIRINGESGSGFSLRVLTKPNDFLEFFSEADVPNIPQYLKSYKYDDPFVTQRFDSSQGLLGIYLFDPKRRGQDGAVLKEGKCSVGLAIWFPVSRNSGQESRYRYINQIAQKSLLRSDDVAKEKPEDDK